jgi:hypothetical protein
VFFTIVRLFDSFRAACVRVLHGAALKFPFMGQSFLVRFLSFDQKRFHWILLFCLHHSFFCSLHGFALILLIFIFALPFKLFLLHLTYGIMHSRPASSFSKLWQIFCLYGSVFIYFQSYLRNQSISHPQILRCSEYFDMAANMKHPRSSFDRGDEIIGPPAF